LNLKDTTWGCTRGKFSDNVFLHPKPSLWHIDPLPGGLHAISSFWRKTNCRKYLGSPYNCTDAYSRLYLEKDAARHKVI
jgi:hypothetical protein